MASRQNCVHKLKRERRTSGIDEAELETLFKWFNKTLLLISILLAMADSAFDNNI